jgi:hypothetical protein
MNRAREPHARGDRENRCPLIPVAADEHHVVVRESVDDRPERARQRKIRMRDDRPTESTDW